MSINPKLKKMISVTIVMILVYVSATFILYDTFLTPNVDKITGFAVTSVNVSESPGAICNFNLYEGANLISFHCIQGMYPLEFTLENISQDYKAIFSYSPSDAKDPWKSYNPNLPLWATQDLSMIYDSGGYWIIMNKNATYYLNGIVNRNSQTSLNAGWNLIGYPRGTSKTPNMAFSSLDGHYDMVLEYKKENNTWYYYAPGNASSTLKMIDPDYGYWIRMTSNYTWVYP